MNQGNEIMKMRHDIIDLESQLRVSEAIGSRKNKTIHSLEVQLK